MNVTITQGYYGYRNAVGRKVVVARGESVELEESEAKRLIDLGVAQLTDTEMPEQSVATPSNDVSEAKSIENSTDAENANEGDLEPCEDFSSMNFMKLKSIAIKRGIDVSGLDSKAKLIEALEQADDEDAPVVTAENPLA